MKFTVRKKMAAVYFTTIPGEPNTANKHIENHILRGIRPCTNKTVYAKFESFWNFSERFYGPF